MIPSAAEHEFLAIRNKTVDRRPIGMIAMYDSCASDRVHRCSLPVKKAESRKGNIFVFLMVYR